jgi:SpoU rRNA methylase family enzyme
VSIVLEKVILPETNDAVECLSGTVLFIAYQLNEKIRQGKKIDYEYEFELLACAVNTLHYAISLYRKDESAEGGQEE